MLAENVGGIQASFSVGLRYLGSKPAKLYAASSHRDVTTEF